MIQFLKNSKKFWKNSRKILDCHYVSKVSTLTRFLGNYVDNYGLAPVYRR